MLNNSKNNLVDQLLPSAVLIEMIEDLIERREKHGVTLELLFDVKEVCRLNDLFLSNQIEEGWL